MLSKLEQIEALYQIDNEDIEGEKHKFFLINYTDRYISKTMSIFGMLLIVIIPGYLYFKPSIAHDLSNTYKGKKIVSDDTNVFADNAY